MPQEWHIRDYGKTISVVRVEGGIGSARYTGISPDAKAALEYLAAKATELQAQLDAEVVAHNETRCTMAAKANVVLQKGIALLEHSQELQDAIAEMRRLRGEFPFV